MLARLLGNLISYPWHALRARRARRLFEAGMASARSGDDEGARRDLERALGIDPAVPDGWISLGDVRRRQAGLDEALACYRTALAIAPASPSALLSLGRALREAGRLDEAISHLRRAYELAPQAEGALRDLVGALVQLDNCDKALSVAADAVAREPSSCESNLVLGFAYLKLHDPERALACFETARRMRPDHADLHDLRGSAYQELGRLGDAFESYDRALALRPDFSLAAFHRALARLLSGDFERGWEDYELRRLSGERAPRANASPSWDGSPLAGRTLLVFREQGLGDEIMFASILPELIGMAGRCILECEPRLRAIFGRSFPGATVFASLEDRSIPYRIGRRGIDLEIGIGSLPRFLRRRAADFPRHAGYLKADPERIARWRQRLAQLGPGLKVGISWIGGVRQTRRALRSLALDRWLPILGVPGARFVSLQYTGDAGEECAALKARHGMRVEHWAEAVDDYDETAALVCALDLVVSVCTTLVHLGGALGRPVWVMAPYSPEWRYGFAGETMPWYPSVRIFRQPAFGQWESVIAVVTREIRHLAGESAGM